MKRDSDYNHRPQPSASGQAARGDQVRARRTILLLGVLALLYFGVLGSFPLLDPDEGRYAEIPREMLASHDFVTPRLDGVVYFEKPPLHYWLTASALAVLGENEVGARFWSALLGVGSVLLCYALGRSMGERRTGVIAAVILATSPLHLGLAHLDSIDITLAFCITLTLACFWLAHLGEGRWERLLWLGVFVGSALSVLAKGLIGVLIPGAVIFLYLLATGRWAVLRRVPWVTGTVIFSVIAVPWHVLAARRNPDFLWFYFVHEHFLRYLTPIARRQEPWWFFVPVLIGGLLPWTGVLPAVASLYRGGVRRLRSDRPELVFLAIWAAFIFLFFSASQSKLVTYVLPCFPPLAVLAALAVARGEQGDGAPAKLVRRGLIAGAALTALLFLALIWQAPERHGEGWAGGPPPPLFVASCLAGLVVSVVGVWLIARRGVSAGLPVVAGAGAFVVVAALAATPSLAAQRSSKDVAAILDGLLQPSDRVVAYEAYPQSLPFYLGRLIDVASYEGELAYGISHLSPDVRARRFPSARQLRDDWLSPARIYLVAERRSIASLDQTGIVPKHVVAEREWFVVLTNHEIDDHAE